MKNNILAKREKNKKRKQERKKIILPLEIIAATKKFNRKSKGKKIKIRNREACFNKLRTILKNQGFEGKNFCFSVSNTRRLPNFKKTELLVILKNKGDSCVLRGNFSAYGGRVLIVGV